MAKRSGVSGEPGWAGKATRLLAGLAMAILGLAIALERQPARGAEAGAIRFREIRETGLEFTLENSPTARKHLPETMAGGVAAFDYNADGLPDLFFANGAEMPSLHKEWPKYGNRLFRNLGGMKFRDVTEASGLRGAGYSIGAAAADFDNDGFPDLFVAGVYRNQLYRNRGDGTFEDITARSGIGSGEWSVGGAWLDYDKDGLLDLFVVNYVRWTPAFDPYCGDEAKGIRVYCHPKVFPGTANRLYRNLGGGRFADVSEESGIAKHEGKGMAAAAADYDGDGLPDIFVTNDKVPNFLFHNLGNGKFEEKAFDAGVALADSGAEISAMGVDFRDVDNDGLPDLLLTALAGETFPLFRNRGGGLFADAGFATRLGAASRVYSGWGTGAFDFDNDGRKDIFAANAHVNDRVEAFEAAEYRQHNAVFRNGRDGRFADVSREAGVAEAVRAHRGCAFADFNGDGRMDVATSSLGDRPELWENTSPSGNGWLVLKLAGWKSNRDGIGARIRLFDEAGAVQANHISSAVGYASSSLGGAHFGLGGKKEAERIEIEWPSGIRQTLRHVRANQTLAVAEPR